MAQLTRAVAALVALAAAASPAAAACLRYEPAQVVLVGRLTPLPDGRHLALRLDHPICVTAGSGHPGMEGVRVVRFNLEALGMGVYAQGGAGRRAAVAGSLFRGAHDREGELSLLVTGVGRAR